MSTLSEGLSVRERNKLTAMLEVQDRALELFEQRGFDGVTINEIAEVAGVGPATVYRHFGTKENIVLWDPSNEAVHVAVIENLVAMPPIEAIYRAVVEALVPHYATDRQLRLMRLAYTESSIVAATAWSDRELLVDLAASIRHANPEFSEVAAAALAGASFAAVDAALAIWQASGGSRPLAELLDESFDAIGTNWP